MMDRETKKAINEAIAHWYRISACKTFDALKKEGFSSESCALCAKFYDCLFCPVEIKVGQGGCYGTPYYKAETSLLAWIETGDWYNTDQDNLEAEIRFLESLLP